MGKFLKRWDMHKGVIANISHDFSPYVEVHGTALSSAVTQNIDDGLTIQNPVTATSLWTAQLVGANTGSYSYELLGTFADGSTQVLEFVADVFDEPVNKNSIPGYGQRFGN